jgi:hypothetical protein
MMYAALSLCKYVEKLAYLKLNERSSFLTPSFHDTEEGKTCAAKAWQAAREPHLSEKAESLTRVQVPTAWGFAVQRLRALHHGNDKLSSGCCHAQI